MKRFLALLVASASIAAAGSVAAQSTPQAPAQSAPPAATPAPAQPPQKPAGRPLILRLDELDGPRMNVGPTATEKPPEKDLPTLGGKPEQSWERSTGQAIPRDSEKAVGY
jgi:hypothetical protein